MGTAESITNETRALPSNGRRQPSRRRPGRPSVAAPFRGFVSNFLASAPDAPTCEILGLARGRGYRGGKTAFYDMVARLRSHLRDRQERQETGLHTAPPPPSHPDSSTP